jgi:DNA processing protein
VRVISPHDAEWPVRLSELGPHDPPTRLFAEGMPLERDKPHVAIVGTRRPTYAGIETARTMATGLAEAGFVIVSGLAIGIDSVAHAAALDAGGATVAVLGCGLDVAYPRRNRSLRERIAARGTILTEYENGTTPAKQNFPRRNRIIAGLGLGVVVIEGTIRSGALVTARLALDANRSVFALPGGVRNPMAEGPNELIRRGEAALATSVGHILEDLAPSLVWDEPDDGPPAPVDLNDIERAVLACLDDAGVTAEAITGALGLKPGRVAVALARLEVRGLLTRTRLGYVPTQAAGRALGHRH